jgi:hypothetical protein
MLVYNKYRKNTKDPIYVKTSTHPIGILLIYFDNSDQSTFTDL